MTSRDDTLHYFLRPPPQQDELRQNVTLKFSCRYSLESVSRNNSCELRNFQLCFDVHMDIDRGTIRWSALYSLDDFTKKCHKSLHQKQMSNSYHLSKYTKVESLYFILVAF